MQLIEWQNPPGNPLGYFNPSYCSSDSLLYFDTYDRFLGEDFGSIYYTKLDSLDQNGLFHWSDPKEMPEPVNYGEYANVMPSISNSGDSLYFSSDRPGSIGGLDIWISERSNGIWGDPVNLGNQINTINNERAPDFCAELGLLFYESNTPSHFSQLLMSEAIGNNSWTLPLFSPR